jgi:phage tail sheath gpL-like
MGFSFNQVPVDIRVPGQYLEIDPSEAYRGLTGIPTKLLVIGQKLTAGTKAPLVPTLITSVDDGNNHFGMGSMLANMIAKVRGANNFLEVWAIAQIDLVSGTAAAGSVTFSGTPTEAGVLNLYIGGKRVRMNVATTDTNAALATKLVAAITAVTDIGVTAAVDGVNTAKVNITFRHKGECGNFIDIRANYYSDEKTPAGMTVTIVAMSGGAGNPDVTDVFTAIGDEWYTDMVMPYTDSANIVAMETELADRFGPLAMIDGHSYIGYSDTHGNLVTKGQARNSPHITSGGLEACPTPPWEVASVLATQCSFYGKQDPARPFQTLPMPGIMPPAVGDRFTLQERDILLRNGISTFTVDSGGVLRIERPITNYRENVAGADDPSYLDLNTLKTLTYLRYDLRTYVALRYPRHKLADDGTNFARGQAVVTPRVIKTAIVNRFKQWESEGLVENVDQFKADLIVERDASDPNRVNALVPPDLVNQLRVFAGLVQFRL